MSMKHKYTLRKCEKWMNRISTQGTMSKKIIIIQTITLSMGEKDHCKRWQNSINNGSNKIHETVSTQSK